MLEDIPPGCGGGCLFGFQLVINITRVSRRRRWGYIFLLSVSKFIPRECESKRIFITNPRRGGKKKPCLCLNQKTMICSLGRKFFFIIIIILFYFRIFLFLLPRGSKNETILSFIYREKFFLLDDKKMQSKNILSSSIRKLLKAEGTNKSIWCTNQKSD